MAQKDFEAEVRRFLDAHAERRHTGGWRFTWGSGDDDVSLFGGSSRQPSAAELENARAWRRLRFDAGLGWISGPPELGGRGLSLSFEEYYGAIEDEYVIPNQSAFGVSIGMVAPTILAYAQTETKRRYLPRLYRGDLIACQLFSEPEAGSDLANVQARAIRDGEPWRISGHKVWTSGAQYSDIGEVLCRTDSQASKHGGLSVFLIDMHSPGVTVRPLRQMTGGHEFNEVYLDDVVTPGDHILGAPQDGWRVALATLGYERASIGATRHSVTKPGNGVPSIEHLSALLDHFGLGADSGLRQRLARIHAGVILTEATAARLRELARDEEPGGSVDAAWSMIKLSVSEILSQVADFVEDALGQRACVDTGCWGEFAWSDFILGVPGMHIGGGTDEIMRDVLAHRVLGLPRVR